VDRERARRAREGRSRDQPLWLQAAGGIGLVTLAGLLAIAVGAVMSAAVSWLF
jgi:hypothetical protein